MLLITFVELRLVAGRSRTRAGRQHAVSERPILIHTYHATPRPRRAHAALCRDLENSLSKWRGRGTARAQHGMYESNTAELCKLNGKDAI
jgi:hypothetical protein